MRFACCGTWTASKYGHIRRSIDAFGIGEGYVLGAHAFLAIGAVCSVELHPILAQYLPGTSDQGKLLFMIDLSAE
jgi:hypothetical protein